MKSWLEAHRGFRLFMLCLGFLRTGVADWNPIPTDVSSGGPQSERGGSDGLQRVTPNRAMQRTGESCATLAFFYR